MKKQKENKKTTNQTEHEAVYVATSINACVICGREIPEGMFVCMECEIGKSQKKCTICGRPIAESEAVCSNCEEMIFRVKFKD